MYQNGKKYSTNQTEAARKYYEINELSIIVMFLLYTVLIIRGLRKKKKPIELISTAITT